MFKFNTRYRMLVYCGVTHILVKEEVKGFMGNLEFDIKLSNRLSTRLSSGL